MRWRSKVPKDENSHWMDYITLIVMGFLVLDTSSLDGGAKFKMAQRNLACNLGQASYNAFACKFKVKMVI
jgi:hypothetical protein